MELEERFGARIIQLGLPADADGVLGNGDIMPAYTAIASLLTREHQGKRVPTEGAVQRPAEHVLPEERTIGVALKAAGGMTPCAFVFDAVFNPESERVTQLENFNRALRDQETSMMRAAVIRRASISDEVVAQLARTASSSQFIERRRTLHLTGRSVLSLSPHRRELPDIAPEDGDLTCVQLIPTTACVFGSPFHSADFLHLLTRSLGEYVRLADGPMKDADEANVFELCANGDVIGNRQNSGWLRSGNLGTAPTLPGDGIFIP